MDARRLDAPPRGAPPTRLARLRPYRWVWLTSRLRARTDSEHEQAIVRLIVGSLAACYLVLSTFAQGAMGLPQVLTIWTCGVFLLAAVLIVAAVVGFPAPSAVRRAVGIVLDTGATSIALWLNGKMAAPMFVVYLWVTFGNGFRFGPRYLAASAALSVVGFSAAVTAHDLWQTDPTGRSASWSDWSSCLPTPRPC